MTDSYTLRMLLPARQAWLHYTMFRALHVSSAGGTTYSIPTRFLERSHHGKVHISAACVQSTCKREGAPKTKTKASRQELKVSHTRPTSTYAPGTAFVGVCQIIHGMMYERCCRFAARSRQELEVSHHSWR